MADQFTEIELPDGRVLEVPVGTPKDAIARAIAQAMGAPVGPDAGVAGFSRGVALGYGDELRAGVRALAPQISEWMMTPPSVGGATPSGAPPVPTQSVSRAPTAGRRYDEELEKARLEKQLSESVSPGWAKGGEIAGNVTSGIALTPGAVGTAGTALGRMLQLGTAGAVAGGVQGFGEGEGDFTSRAQNAVIPTLAGGALGAASEPGMAIVRALYQWAVPGTMRAAGEALERGAQIPNRSASSSAATPTVAQDSIRLRVADFLRNSADDMVGRAAVAKIADDLKAGRLTPEEAQAQVARLGEEGMLIDVNPNLQRTARDAYILPGEGREVIDTALDARRATEGARLRDAAGVTPNTPPMPQAREFLETLQTTGGAEVYDRALRNTPLNVSDEMAALMQRPSVQEAERSVRAAFAREGRQPTEGEVAHKIKEHLNLNANARANTEAVDKRLVGDTATEWEQALWRANQHIRDADVAYAQAGGAVRRLDEGRNFMQRGTGEAAEARQPYSLAQEVPNMVPGERTALEWGAQNAIREGTDSFDRTRSVVRALTRSDPQEGVTARLPHLIGPENTANLVRESQVQALQTGAERSVRGGAVERAGDVQAALGNMPSVGGAPTDARSVLTRTADWFLDAAARAREPNEAVRNELARRLVARGEVNRETLELARRLMDERLQRAVIAPGASAAAGNLVIDITK
jgi:hypothetical protein